MGSAQVATFEASGGRAIYRRFRTQPRLNTELAKKPKDLLEHVVVHEVLHLVESTHNEPFVALMTNAYPGWREARAELNELPLAAEVWKE